MRAGIFDESGERRGLLPDFHPDFVGLRVDCAAVFADAGGKTVDADAAVCVGRHGLPGICGWADRILPILGCCGAGGDYGHA